MEEGEAGCSKQIRQGAGSLSTHVFHLAERALSAEQGEEGGWCVSWWGGNGTFPI